ncbi:hypothetical protein I5N09_03050 [Serratia marcescens]|jgi:ABC-type transport system involved in Fe-S cluster assembly fused permease/ATPase subunit|uniref:Uncharacterized protein n=2 Tax=Serratia TaxID=613 RepID=A0ABD6HZJ8_SERMA|nr:MULTISPECIES: hypothetical protein [Serratia]ALL38338.1 hypothetical protein AR325_15700 [Serratia marcescens]ANM77917.1 hypothetical protein A4U88_4184 [Serratia marcescens]KFF89560.1 hypothetical protein JL05_16085 [Serratia nematodiphila DZ0503SBS1]KMJ14734.1 hypothetical protein SN04_01634 [Serratia marcescens]MBH3097600.1 hypothetical protein [Serratia marcescens]
MNSNHLASIARSEKICFDYMDFLSASCRKHWRFVDAIYGVMPIFGMVLKSRVTTSQTRKEQLKELALQVVSTQVSDETNIVRLIDLAQQQGLTVFDIQLPYALEAQQLAAIQKECEKGIAIALVGERMTITIPPKS